jgi:hypothetical protein
LSQAYCFTNANINARPSGEGRTIQQFDRIKNGRKAILLSALTLNSVVNRGLVVVPVLPIVPGSARAAGSGITAHTIIVTMIAFVFDAFVYFFPMNADFTGRLNAKTHLIPFYSENRHINVIAYDYRFANSSGQDQHCCLLPLSLLFLSSLPEGINRAIFRFVFLSLFDAGFVERKYGYLFIVAA